MSWFGVVAVGLACFWLTLIAVTWASFGGFFTAIFALAFEHLRNRQDPTPGK